MGRSSVDLIWVFKRSIDGVYEHWQARGGIAGGCFLVIHALDITTIWAAAIHAEILATAVLKYSSLVHLINIETLCISKHTSSFLIYVHS